MCTVLLPPGDNPIAVNKYIISYHIIEIVQIIVSHLKEKYSPIDVSDSCVTEMLNAIRPNTPPSYAAYLEQLITAEELQAALISGGGNKAPWSHGISLDFCIRLWDTIRDDMLGVMNQMYIHNSMTRHQQNAIIMSAQVHGRQNTRGISPDNADEYGLQTIS